MNVAKKIAATIMIMAACVLIAGNASALVVRPAVAGLPGIVVTPGFTMSFYVPDKVGNAKNPDSPANANKIPDIEAFLETKKIIGKDVAYVGKGQTNKKVNPIGNIFYIDLKSWGVVTYFYATQISSFSVKLPSYISNSNNIQYEVFNLVPVKPPIPGVPLPPSFLLFATGLMGISALGRRRLTVI